MLENSENVALVFSYSRWNYKCLSYGCEFILNIFRMFQEVWKEKFYELKLPGVVKSEILKYADFKHVAFEFNNYYLQRLVSDVEKEEEKIRQI